jgi:hypothetical protein
VGLQSAIHKDVFEHAVKDSVRLFLGREQAFELGTYGTNQGINGGLSRHGACLWLIVERENRGKIDANLTPKIL